MGTSEVYQGHPTTVLTDDDKTLFCAWTIDHGGPCGPFARSDDHGKTWQRIDHLLPEGYRTTHRNCPTLQSVYPPEGGEQRLVVFSSKAVGKNRRGLGVLMSLDGGESWFETPNAPQLSAGMPPTGLMRLKDGSTALFGQVRKDPNVKTDRATDDQNVWMSVSRDGGFTWGEPKTVAQAEKKNLCEPFALRSPDGDEIALLMRENRHDARSMMCFSRDEGKTWTEPVDTCWGLTGDRHEGVQLPDGRWLIAFRDRALGSSTLGQYVAWVGSYDELRSGKPGQFRIHLLKNWSGEPHGGRLGDTGYSGVELMPDGSILCTTYVKFYPDDRQHSVVSTRFRVEGNTVK
ncbi:MAG: exo-alpha-sialidase [Verrucomicrobiaceae bacterium]|nr:exo-alpha-sialidase [Verrucomicrobiaceae bacterium]